MLARRLPVAAVERHPRARSTQGRREALASAAAARVKGGAILHTTESPVASHISLSERYLEVRHMTERLCAPLEVEDYLIQSMPDCSPTRWHIAHTTWFFETFVLNRLNPGQEPLNPAYAYLFNSYYEAVGDRFPRPRRGLLSRPTVKEVYDYRAWVDDLVVEGLSSASDEVLREVGPIVVLGLHHEQQHQELLLTDIKNAFSVNPLKPSYQGHTEYEESLPLDLRWIKIDGGLVDIGHEGTGFAYDNEGPRHPEYVAPYHLASRLVTNGEIRRFIEEDGYQRPDLWLSAGWHTVQEQGWEAPLYWERRGEDDDWSLFTLSGMRPIVETEPACHLSYFEADAFARWADARLPTEAEWETAAAGQPMVGNLMESGLLHPSSRLRPGGAASISQLYGDVWEWTQSSYSPYPGYRPLEGALGEYNGKFMCNQYVLRGGSCATPESHLRPTYRNFFPADARWQFSGLRLARDA
jgi:ergothioneine biosynthesis protein EgtB